MALLRALLLLITLALATQAWAQATAQRRLALVIGNNAYPGAPLLNPINDARAMAAALESTGFSVMLRTDATQREMLAAVREFGDRLKAGGGVGVFYFAGHGMQIKGRNFLIPVGSEIEREDEVAYQAIEAQAVLDKMESAGNGTNLMILDACRDNPFTRSFRSGQQGLAPMDAPVGTLVAFATAPGLRAADGQGRNGLYTSHLLAAMRQPGLKVEDVFKQVRSAVRRESQGRQIPMEWSSLEGDFYFVPAAATATAAPAPAAAPVVDVQAAIDDALWETVKDSASSAEIFAYLNRFPLGRHAKQARTRMADLTAPRPLALPASTDPLEPMSEAQREAHNEQVLAESVRKLDEISVWGEVGTELRPLNPHRNAAGFAEGDRFRYILTGANLRQSYIWRIDRIEADGSLWVNDGRQRLDALGQRQAGNDEHTGEWQDWKPPLPVAAAARRGPGHTETVAVSVQARDADGRNTVYTLRGPLVTEADSVRTPSHVAGLAAAIKVTVKLEGSSLRSDGVNRRVQWDHVYWYAVDQPILLAAEMTEYGDSIPVRHLRHDLVAIDALQVPPRLAGSSP